MSRKLIGKSALAIAAAVCATAMSMANDAAPPRLEHGVVGVHAVPSADAGGHPHVLGAVYNRSEKSWLAIHFVCRSDNKRADGLQPYAFELNIRFQSPLEPDERRRFDVLPDAAADRTRLKEALIKYPQSYWWFCDGVNATGDDTEHQAFTIGPQIPPTPVSGGIPPALNQH